MTTSGEMDEKQCTSCEKRAREARRAPQDGADIADVCGDGERRR
jgi:hypothetical protein